MEKIKKLIILFIIIIIIIILTLLLLLKNVNNKNEINNEEYSENSEEYIPEQDDNGYVDVSDSNLFYSVFNSVNKYIDIMKYNFNTEINEEDLYKYYDIDQEYLFNIKSEKQRIEAVYSLLDEKYKESNNINLNNIKQFIYPIYEDTIIIPIKMKVKYGTNINTFILKTYLKDNDLEERYFIIRTNNKNQTFSIEFLDEKDNKEELEYVQITKYYVESELNITKYVCVDQYENTYVFSENATMQYNVMLDTYTLITEKFIETYKNAKDIEKVQLNVDKFIKMMNSHDYINIYKYLSEGFKERYFKTEGEFEKYIKSIFYRYNKITYKNVTKKGSDIYIANIEIEDLTGKNDEKKELNIIIQLIDETKFVMSFGIE